MKQKPVAQRAFLKFFPMVLVAIGFSSHSITLNILLPLFAFLYLVLFELDGEEP